jgi:16S rRNA processing protein RimM
MATNKSLATPDSRLPVPDWDALILVGVVARSHGNKGEVIVNSETDFPEERFRPGGRLHTRLPGGEERLLVVTSSRMHQGRPVLALDGYGSISDAEGLAGCELRVPESEQAPLPPGLFYHHQLVGCEVVGEDGGAIGRVAKVEGGTGTSRLVVRGPRKELQIPLADEICTVDIARKRITVRPPEGLLEL